MSNEPRTATIVEQEEARRAQLLRTTLSAGAIGSGIGLVLFVALGWLTPNFPAQYLVPIAAVFLALILVAFWFLRRGRVFWAVNITLAATSAMLFAIIPFLNGVTGPIAPTLIVLPLLTALLLSRTETLRMTIGAGSLYLVMAILEGLDVLQPWEISGLALPITQHVLLIFSLATGTYLVAYSTSLTQEALIATHRRGQELVRASLEAEQAALAESEAREREERIAGELRQAVREYSSFLQQVVAGDYSARLELKEADGADEVSSELTTFGQQLNEAVETLVEALSDLQAVQQRYLQQAWEKPSISGSTHQGYRCQDAEVEPADAAWLAPMTEAVTEQAMVATDREVAMPIALRGQIIGAIGARREGAAAWSSADIALVETITDQLAQTMESLRLLDETQHSAARDRLLTESTARMRGTLDVASVLRTAANELYQALGLEEVVVRLVADKAQEKNR